MKTKLRVITLISGRGSNLQSLIEHAKNYEIIAVLSNKPAAPGLHFARQANISCHTFERKEFESVQSLKRCMLESALKLAPDVITLAGFMLLVEPEFIAAFPGRILNIHPSLLPKFPGLDTHARAVAAKEREHGCSVHVVDSGVDTGPLIAQAKLQILPGEDEETLAARVLKLEHRIYPWVLNQVALGEIKLFPAGPVATAAAARSAAQSEIDLRCKLA